MFRPIWTLLLFLLLGSLMDAQAQRAAGRLLNTVEVDSVVTNLMKAGGVTGLQLGIVRDNRVAYVQSYGYKNRARGQLNDTATCFYGASLSKAVFAWLVMQLVEENLIQLDTPLYTYLPRPLPEYPNYTDLAGDERWRLITARHCLDHTTGFPNWRFFNPHDNKKLEIFFTPGTRYAYSGEGLYLLQMVIEIKTGRSLEDLASEKIFRPLGMRRTSYLWQPAFETDYAVGHTVDGDTLAKNRRSKENAAGSMETTIADMTRYVAGVMQGLAATEKKQGLAATPSKLEMIRPQIAIYEKHQFPSLNTDSTLDNRSIGLSYGLGWGLFKSPVAGKVFFKEGHDDGWQHYMICIPEQKSAFIFMSNSDNAESIYKELTQRLTGISIPWEWEGYMPYRHTIAIPAAALKQWVGVYDGIQKVTIFLDGGQLKLKGANIPPMTLYPVSKSHFFLKRGQAELKFQRGADGVAKVRVEDDGDPYQLVKTGR